VILTTAARQLIEVDRSRQRGPGSIARVIPPAAAVGNLLFCATFEPFLRENPSGHFLSLFLLVECAVLIFLNISYFGGKTSHVLARTRIYPIAPSERFSSTIAVEIRRKLVIALVVSTGVFLAILYATSPVACACAVATYLLMAAAVELLTSTLALLLLRTPHPSASALALLGVAVLAITIGLIAFDIADLLAGVPIVNWGAAGIMAGSRGDIPIALLNAGYITATGMGAGFIGSRHS
jgi:hypothetical protein